MWELFHATIRCSCVMDAQNGMEHEFEQASAHAQHVVTVNLLVASDPSYEFSGDSRLPIRLHIIVQCRYV